MFNILKVCDKYCMHILQLPNISCYAFAGSVFKRPRPSPRNNGMSSTREPCLAAEQDGGRRPIAGPGQTFP